jgi:hypothetical protein
MASNVVSFKQIKDVRIDDRVIVIPDISKEMACFFISEAVDVLHKPIPSVVPIQRMEDYPKIMLVFHRVDDIRGACMWESISACFEFFCECFFGACRKTGAELGVDLDGPLCTEICGKDAEGEFFEEFVG